MKRGGFFSLPSVVLLAVCLLFAAPTFAQRVTGDITGTVNDPSGAAVPGATVTAENLATKLTRTTTSGEQGLYRIPELPPGTYKVSATAAGFKTTQRDVVVAIGQITTTDFVLQVGDRAEMIVVEASTPLIEFSERLNSNVDQARIENLPFSGRDFNSLLGITPGVQRQPGGGFLAVNINGARRTANNYLVDGMYNNDRYYGDSALNQTGVLGIPATLLSLDAITEFTVQQLPSAEYGVKGGASINVALKSGGNDLHGSAYYFGHWDATDAASPITQAVTPLTNHQYGATISGPFVKDRTFFMGYFEGQRNDSVPQYQNTLATPADFAMGRALAASVFAQTNPGQMCCPGDALASFFPTDPNVFVPARAPNEAKMSTFGLKIDHKLSDEHNVSGRYIIGDGTQSAPSVGYTIAPAPGNVAGLGTDGFNSFAPSRAQLLGISWTYAISPNKILESRFGWTRFSQILGPNNKVDPRSLGIDTGPLDPADFGVPYVYMYYVNQYGYIGGVGGYPIATRPDQTFDQAEHFTWTKGRHTMKMGGNWQYANTDSLRNNARTRFFIFNDSNPINAIAQLFLLKFDRAFRNFGDTHRRIYQHTLGVYWQDEWKLSPHVTVNFGVRYDIHGALGESSKLGGNFDPVLGPVRLTLQGDGGLKRIHELDLNNFGPRAGLAWDIFGNGKTALRIGYALTYDVLNFGAIHAPRNTSFNSARVGTFTNITQGVFTTRLDGDFGTLVSDPNATCFDVTTGSGDFVCAANQPVFGANPQINPFFPIPFQGTERDLKTPMIHYYTLSVQHELFKNSVLTVSYVGTQARNLTLLRDINARPIGCRDPNTGAQLRTGNCARPFDAAFQVNGAPMFHSIVLLTDDGKSWYDSLQVGFRQRNWKGINTEYNFTWSHCVDYGSINRGNRTNIPPSQNPWIPASNKGNCDHDVRRNFNIGGTYDLPKVEAMGRFGEGWQIGTVLTLIDGRPFSATQGSRDRSGQDVNGTLHANCNASPQYNRDNPRDPNTGYIINDSDFTVATINTIGTCGRNVFVGPGLAQWDLSLTKDTRITEGVTFQFRWQVFNVLNRPHFANPATDVRFGFGNITTTPDLFNPVISQGGPRSMEFGFKIKF
jgi:hypothetical protein